MGCGADRLSYLPNDLILRVLHFAPAKEAASTTALSRGWRSPLWRSSGALNLEARVEAYDRYAHWWIKEDERKEPDKALFFSRRDAFVSAALAALDAADVVLTRLTLRLELVGHRNSLNMFLHGDRDSDGSPSPYPDVLTNLLCHRAARRVEELRLAAEECRSDNDAYKDDGGREITSCDELGMFRLSLGSLPSDTLRVLELTACKGLVPLPPACAVVFQRLSSLRLRRCTVLIEDLQSLVDAAPALADVHLESVTIGQYSDPSVTEYYYPASTETVILRCPAATVLVLDSCHWKVKARPWPHQDSIVQIDAPRMQRFGYKGYLGQVSLSPPPPDLARADLHFVRHRRRRDDENENNYLCSDRKKKRDGTDADPNHERDLVAFWRFLQSVATVRELKLRVAALEHIALLTKARRLKLLPVLSGLHRLELHGVHRPKAKTAAVAIANLLRCCPALRDLWINLAAAHHEPEFRHNEYIFLQRKFRSDRDKSICLFNSAPLTPSPEGIAEGANYEEVSDIPVLSRRSFDCLRSSLTRVGLQFRLEDGNSFGVNLIKFFAENAMVLEEMCIDGGNDKLDEHITCKVERWIADSSIRRKPGASTFVVLPLKR